LLTVLNCAKFMENHGNPWRFMPARLFFANKYYMPVNIGYYLGFGWVL
jgi:hypothetical protein